MFFVSYLTFFLRQNYHALCESRNPVFFWNPAGKLGLDFFKINKLSPSYKNNYLGLSLFLSSLLLLLPVFPSFATLTLSLLFYIPSTSPFRTAFSFPFLSPFLFLPPPLGIHPSLQWNLSLSLPLHQRDLEEKGMPNPPHLPPPVPQD